MGSASVPEGLIKKEIAIIAALVALIVGFLGGVIFSSFKAPQLPPTAGQGTPQPTQAMPQAQTGPTAEQGVRILSLEEAVKKNPNNAEAWANLGNIYFDTAQSAKSIAAYNKSLELNPAQPDVLTDLGVMYRQTKQFKEALIAFDKAISLQPNFEQAYFNKGVVLLHDLGDKSGGLDAWQRVVDINPNAHAPNGQPVRDLLAQARK